MAAGRGDGGAGDDSSLQFSTFDLLNKVMYRATSTLASPTEKTVVLDSQSTDEVAQAEGEVKGANIDVSTRNMLGKAIQRASDSLDRRATTEKVTGASSVTESASQQGPRLPYSENPIVTPTALAHTIWRQVLPFSSPIAFIDATCGNGHDSVALAKMLLSGCRDSELICVDIQEAACEATRQALRLVLPDEQMDRQVRIVRASHAPTLPRPSVPVGIVCYNLGWLPKSTVEEKSMFLTKMETTLQSLEDAVQLLGVGGILSVMTYPKTNPNEDHAVHAFLEALALRSTSMDVVADFLEELGPDPDGSTTSVREAVTASIQRVVASCPNQVWRVVEHRQMGRDLAPILLVATRIK